MKSENPLWKSTFHDLFHRGFSYYYLFQITLSVCSAHRSVCLVSEIFLAGIIIIILFGSLLSIINDIFFGSFVNVFFFNSPVSIVIGCG